MKSLPRPYVVLFAAFTFIAHPSAQADTFGTSGNEFTIDFVNIGNPDNAAQSASNRSHTNSGGDGRGSVPYEYRMGTYEITQDAINKATASGMANVTAGAWTGNQPAANISWYEAAAFVNWLNTSTGKQAAYNLTFTTSWSMTLWSSADAWTAGGTNLYRNKDAFYFLPSENEWYKAAYYNPGGSNYFFYPTASDTAPTAVASGTDAGTAVYAQPAPQGPAGVDVAGALSSYGTMGQGGNAYEWMETAFDGTNHSATEHRAIRGGTWGSTEAFLRSSVRGPGQLPGVESTGIGFRVASVEVIPEPSTYALVLMGVGALYLWKRRKGLSRS